MFLLLTLPTITNYPADINPKSVGICPQECLCTTDVSKLDPAVKVQCGERNLGSVPSTTLDKLVSLLNVSFNDLNTVKDNTFLHYESVKYIYLQHCKLESISDKTFQHLENLLIVDLSNNLLTSLSPNLFKGNHHLHTVILRNNDFSTFQGNTALLDGPSSLVSLDLQSCQLSYLSSVTFSLLPNLKKLDISNNKLDHLNFDTLSAHQQLQDVNLENNRLKCGPEFDKLWSGMQSSPSLFHNRTLKCWHKNNTLEIRTPETRPISTPPVIPPLQPDTIANTAMQLSTTPSHKPDTNTSATLKYSVTPSDNSDVSRNATVKTTTSENETDTLSVTNIIIICPLIFVLVFIVIFVVNVIVRRCTRGNAPRYTQGYVQNQNA